MKFRSLNYYLREALISLFRNRLMTLASIMTVAACILMLSISYCIAANIDYMLLQLEDSVTTLSIYVEQDVEAAGVAVLHEKIKQVPYVKSVTYKTAEEALIEFSETLDEASEGILEGLGGPGNPLPRSFVVTLEDAKHQKEVMDALDALKELGIEKIVYKDTIINIITTINTGIRIISLIVIGSLFAISVVIIVNTVKITVNNRRTEISIMKYVGATDWFIRWPFLIEGAWIGIFGAAIALLICWLSYGGALDAITMRVSVLQNLVHFKPSFEIFTILLPMTLFAGIGIGIVGSAMSIRKYLKV